MNIQPAFLSEPGVAKVISVFEQHLPDSVRIVGGCVRDAIIGREVSDIDFATPLRPEQVTRLFQLAGFRVEPTGIEHGTVTVIWNHQPYEITTLRRDVETDGRRAVVAFTTSWIEDAERRDFRCNALYLRPNGDVDDPTGGGVDDILNKKLVFVGDASMRIREDALRIVRLYRFMSTLGFDGDAEAHDACSKHADLIRNLSGERLEKETVKLVRGPHVIKALKNLYVDDVFQELFLFEPELSDLTRRFQRMLDLKIDIEPLNLVWLWSVEKADAVCRRWKTSKDMRFKTVDLMVDEFVFSRLDRRVVWAEVNRSNLEATIQRVRLGFLDDAEATSLELEQLENFARAAPLFPLKGQDLLDAGMSPGREIGETLTKLKSWWIDNDFPEDAVLRKKVARVVNSATTP